MLRGVEGEDHKDGRRYLATRPSIFRRIGEPHGINPETIRNCVQRAETDEGDRPGTTTDQAARRVSTPAYGPLWRRPAGRQWLDPDRETSNQRHIFSTDGAFGATA